MRFFLHENSRCNMINSYTDNYPTVITSTATSTGTMSFEQLKAKVVANLEAIKALQTDVSSLTKHIIEKSKEIEELRSNGGGGQEDDELDDLLLSFDDHLSVDDDDDAVGKLDVLQRDLSICCELINLKKNEIIFLLNAAETDSFELLKMKQELEQEQQEPEPVVEELIDLKSDLNDAHVDSTVNINLMYSKEELMGLAKVPSALSPPPIDANIRDKFPELFPDKLFRKHQQQTDSHNKLRRKSWRSTNNFC